jgi:hypothetical protein
MGNAHLGGMLHGIAHTCFEVHGDGVLGLDVSQGSQDGHQNEKIMFYSHRTQIFFVPKESISHAKNIKY